MVETAVLPVKQEKVKVEEEINLPSQIVDMKNLGLKNISIVFLFHLFAVIQINGQWKFSLSTSQEYSDNPFHYPIPISTLISSADFGTEYHFSPFGIGYYGNYSMFHEITDQNYYWHQFGIWNSANNIMYGLYAEQRYNSINYELYDYSNYNAYFRYKFELEGINCFTNTALSLTDYGNLNDLDNLLGTAGIKLNKSFETKTTLIGGINFNYKNYFDTNLNDPLLIGDSLEQSFSPSAFTSQVSFYGRIAQSIFENTGLAVQYSQQNIIAGTAKYVRQLDYIYGDESQYFDDPISYEGYNLTAQLTQILPGTVILKGIYSYIKKEYPSQGIYFNPDFFSSATLRNDDQNIIKLSLLKKFSLANSFMILSLSYIYNNNESNSYWYNYKTSELKLNIDYQF